MGGCTYVERETDRQRERERERERERQREERATARAPPSPRRRPNSAMGKSVRTQQQIADGGTLDEREQVGCGVTTGKQKSGGGGEWLQWLRMYSLWTLLYCLIYFCISPGFCFCKNK
jgi:hypothetical protein